MKQIGLEDNLTHLRWMEGIIYDAEGRSLGSWPFVMDQEGLIKFYNEGLVDVGVSQVGPTKGNNVLSPDRVTLVVGIMEGYEIYIAKIVTREIRN